jgi:hypothetical protein
MGRQLGVEVGNGCLGLLQVLPKVVSRGSLLIQYDSQCDIVVIQLLLLLEVLLSHECEASRRPTSSLRAPTSFLMGLLLLLYDFLAAVMLCIDQPVEHSL